MAEQLTNATMDVMDTISGKLGSCFTTINGRRYNFMQARKITATVEKLKTAVPILGKTGQSNKSTGWKGSGSAEFYFNTSIFAEMMETFKDSGKDIYFTMQLINDDPNSKSYGQQVTLIDCNLDKVILAALDITSDDPLTSSTDFTFDDYHIDKPFNDLDGM